MSTQSQPDTGQPGVNTGPFTPAAHTRRRILVGTAVGAALAAIATACGSGNKNTGAGATSTTHSENPSGNTAPPESDLAVAKVAAGLEVLAVGTYKAALDAATAGKLGDVPPAVAQYVHTAMAQHQEHLDGWNKVLTGAGKPKVTEPNATLKPTVDTEFAKVTDVGGVANLAIMLEQIAAQTYLKVMPTLKTKTAIQMAGAIQIVDQQHQAILYFALGQYPVPEVFQSTDKAATG